MTHRLRSTLALGLVAGLLSCTSLDESLISGVSSQYYETPDGLGSALIASYSQLRNFYGREQLMSLTQVGTDTWMAADQSGSNNKEFDSYNGGLNSTVGPVANTWNPAYQAINTLNAALDRGPNTTGLSAAVKSSLLGEAHFLRALNYFTLVQTFGDLTLSLHENKGVQSSAVRDPASAVYTAILADLDSAVSMLPVTQADYGRATKGAALTLRSKVYLTRAYQPFSPGKAADFTASLADAKAVINSGTYTLEPVFANLWCVARAADPNRTGYCENTGYNSNHSEFIFTVQFSYDLTQYDANDQYDYMHLVYLSQYDNNGIWVGTPRDINNGRPFRRAMATPYELSIWNKWSGTPGASPVLDTRFDASFQTVWNAFRQSKAYAILTPCPSNQADSTAAGYCGDRNNANDGYTNWQHFPSLKKFQDNLRTTVAQQEGGKVEVVFRLGEVYLIAAEADIGLGNTAEAATFVNVLHQRAAAPAFKATYTVAAAQMTIDYIMEERERELAGEHDRWYDMVRPGAQYFVDRVKKYNPHAAANIALRFALRPIPQSQIDGVIVGPKYPQNPGY